MVQPLHQELTGLEASFVLAQRARLFDGRIREAGYNGRGLHHWSRCERSGRYDIELGRHPGYVVPRDAAENLIFSWLARSSEGLRGGLPRGDFGLPEDVRLVLGPVVIAGVRAQLHDDEVVRDRSVVLGGEADLLSGGDSERLW